MTFTLGTVSHDVQCVNKKAQTIGDELKEKAQEEIDKQDIDAYFQPISIPTIGEINNLVGKRIQMMSK